LIINFYNKYFITLNFAAMKKNNRSQPDQRRTFLKQIATGAAVLSAGMFAAPLHLSAAENLSSPDVSAADEWFKQIKGKHKIVFDVPQPHEIFPFAWPKVFLLTNAATGTPEKDCSVVVILRHAAIAYAMGNPLWEKYKFGNMFKVNDPATKTPATQNPFWQPKPGAFKIPGIGEVQIGINELQASGVMFCVCDMAMTVSSAVAAQSMNQDPAAIKKEWVAGLLPGVQPVPSGVWAVGRAQEHGCTYCFVG
jgi:intracellular sulfur oxidation DsrE/DsrF family protein